MQNLYFTFVAAILFDIETYKFKSIFSKGETHFQNEMRKDSLIEIENLIFIIFHYEFPKLKIYICKRLERISLMKFQFEFVDLN